MKRLLLAGQIGFTYIGTVVGAGFASGQEIFQFFSVFGKYGTIGILLAILLFILLGTRMMLLGAKLKATSYQVFNLYLFGSRWGPLMNGFVGLTLFGVITAMLSGTGSLAREQLGLSFHIGVIVTIVLAYVVIVKGMDGILSINSLVVPLMFFFTLVILGQSFMEGDWQQSLLIHTKDVGGHWILSALSYVAFNLAMAQAVLVPLGGEIKDEKTLRLGGWIGGIGLGFMMLVNNLALQMDFFTVKEMEIPIAAIIGTLGDGMKYFFIAVMWGEIFTTVIGNVYGLATHLQQVWGWPLNIWVAVLFVVAYLCSLVGFPAIISYLYPFFGYCGFTVLILLAGRRLPQY